MTAAIESIGLIDLKFSNFFTPFVYFSSNLVEVMLLKIYFLYLSSLVNRYNTNAALAIISSSTSGSLYVKFLSLYLNLYIHLFSSFIPQSKAHSALFNHFLYFSSGQVVHSLKHIDNIPAASAYLNVSSLVLNPI